MSVYASMWGASQYAPPGPIRYQDSGVVPSHGDERGGFVDVAEILDGGGDLPYLRLSVDDAVVVLDRDQVAGLTHALEGWLQRSGPDRRSVRP